MKYITNKILKFTLIGILLGIVSCEVQENFNTASKRNILVKDFSLQSIQGKINSKLLETANKIKNLNIISKNSKSVYNSDFDFYMEDEHGKHVIVDGKNSYTFEITRTTGEQKVENIIFNEKTDGSFDSYIAKYNFTKDDFINLPVNVLKEKNIDYTVLNTQTNRYNPICIEEQTYVTGDYYYSCDLNVGGGSGDGHWVTIGVSCGSGFDNSDSGGSGGGYNPSNGGGNPSNPSHSVGGGSTGVNTTPVLLASPCKKVQKQKDKFASLIPALVTLSATTGQNHENGVFINSAATATTPNPIQTIPANSNIGGAIQPNPYPTYPYAMIAHTHDAFGEGNGTYSIFSFSDLQTLSNLILANHIDTDNFVFYLTTADNTQYAMTIDNPTEFAESLNFLGDPANPVYDGIKADTNKDIEEKYYGKKAGTIKPDSNPVTDKVMFLKMLKELGNNATLFEVNSNFTTFNKLSINSSGVVSNSPCTN